MPAILLFIALAIIGGSYVVIEMVLPARAASARQAENVITMGDYLRLTGDLYEWDVKRILGRDGTEQARIVSGGVETVSYLWENPDGSNVLLMFQGKRLISRAQAGLK